MKKKIISALAVLLVALIAVTVLNNGGFFSSDNSYVDDGTAKPPTQTYTPPYLYPADWETDIFTMEEYTSKELDMTYASEMANFDVLYAETVYTRIECQAKGGSALVLMYDYFDYLRHGDNEGVNSLYIDGYFDGEEKKPYDKFPMQKIYDVLVCKSDQKNEELEENESVTPTYYLVTYKIMYNDGMFRDDMGSDEERTQLIGVLTFADGTSRIYMTMELPGVSINKTF